MFLNGDPNKLQNGYKVKTIFNKFDIDYIINKLVLSDRGKVFALNVPVELNIQLKVCGVQDELKHVMLLFLAKPDFRCFQEQNKVPNMQGYIYY